MRRTLHRFRASQRTMTAGILAMAMLVAGILAAEPAMAADTTPPRLVDVTLSRDSVSVSGLNLVPVTISVHLTDDVGVVYAGEMDQSITPQASLSQVGGPGVDWSELKFTSGTAQDGIWSATMSVPSTWNGQWQVTGVAARDEAYNRLAVDPRAMSIVRTLRVTGTHQPALTVGFSPDPVEGNGAVTVKGRVYYSDTGAPIAHQKVGVGVDNQCVEGGFARTVTTNSQGYYSKALPKGWAVLVRCVAIPRPSTTRWPAYIVIRVRTPRMKYAVNAWAVRASAPVGAGVEVTGSIYPSYRGKVYLQRLVGTSWRTVDEDSLKWWRRFHLTAKLPVAGEHRYRVLVPGDGDSRVSGTSRTIVITATPGSGAQLPITGPRVGLLSGIALVLSLTGVGLVLMARRRRRIHFVS